MKNYPVASVRNVGLLAHGGAGKTSLGEAMLFTSGAISRLGRVEDGNTTSDWDPDEIKRTISISTSILPIEWNDHKINVLDTPGYADFSGDVIASTRVIDCAIILLDASAGVEVGTEFAWRYADDQNLPRMIVVNKIDRENANFATTLESARAAFGNAVAPLYIPIGEESSFRGVVDLIRMKAIMFADDGSGNSEVTEIPGDMLDAAETYRLQIVESIAENDEELMLKYLEDEELTEEELIGGLKTAVAAGQIVPVLVTSATTNRGVGLILDAIVELAPPPRATVASTDAGDVLELQPTESEPVSLFIWKTVADPFVGKLSMFKVLSGTIKSDTHLWNVNKGEDERLAQIFVLRGKEQINVDQLGPGEIGAVGKLDSTSTSDILTDPSRKVRVEPIPFPAPLFSAAVVPASKSDLDKMSQALARLAEEDPSISVSRNPESGETLVSGLGESHVQIALDRVQRKFGVHMTSTLPTVPYRETVRKAVVGAEHRHKRQTGGHGQFGHVKIDVEPCDEDFVFEEKIFGGAIPRQFIPAVEKGVREAMEHGVLAGFPVTNLKVTLTDGSYHTVDSSEMAFKIASSQAFKKAQEQASPVILEPVNKLAVTVPDLFTGDVMGDLAGKRAHVTGMVPGENGYSTIEAMVPAAEVQRYATDLRSITQGRGVFTSEFDHYAEVPSHLTDGIIAAQKEHDEALV